MDHYPQNAPIQTGPQGPLISCVAPVYGTKLKYVRVFVQSVQAKTLLLSCNYVNHLVAVRQSLMNKLEGAWTDRVNGTQDWDFLYRITPLQNVFIIFLLSSTTGAHGKARSLLVRSHGHKKHLSSCRKRNCKDAALLCIGQQSKTTGPLLFSPIKVWSQSFTASCC